MNIQKRYMRIKKFYRNIIITFLIAFISLLVGLYIIFSLIRLIPGDPVAAYLAAVGIHNPTDEQYQQMAKLLGIDDFFSFIGALFTGEWRISVSLIPGVPVYDFIEETLLKMIGVLIIPLIIGIGIGIFLGRVSSKNRGTWKDKAIHDPLEPTPR